MPNEKGVNVEDSPTSKRSDDPSDQGDDPSKKSDRTLEQVLAENKRKAQEIAELKARSQEMQEKFEARLEQLENKTKLTRSEKEEKEELEGVVAQLANDQRSKAWRILGKRDATEVFEEQLKNADVMKRIIEGVDYEYALDRTEELAEKEEMELEEFQKVMFPYLKRFQGKPTTKLKKAYAAYCEDRDTKAKLKKLEEIDHRETGGGKPRGTGKAENFDEANKSGNMTLYLKRLAEAQERASSGKK